MTKTYLSRNSPVSHFKQCNEGNFRANFTYVKCISNTITIIRCIIDACQNDSSTNEILSLKITIDSLENMRSLRWTTGLTNIVSLTLYNLRIRTIEYSLS